MNKLIKIYSGLPLSIYILFLARIINSAGNFVYPFLTLYLTSKIGLSEEQVGFYVMLSLIAGIPGNFIGGALADKIGRKTIFISVQVISAMLLVPCAFLERSMLIPWLLILANVFSNAARPINGAMVSDLTFGNDRIRAQSLLYLGINIGFSVGPLLAGFLFENHTPWIFIGDAFTTLLAMSLTFAFVSETKPQHNKEEEMGNTNPDEKPVEGSTLAAILARPVLVAFCLISSILSFVYSQHTFTLPIYMNGIFGENGARNFGMLMTTNGIVVVFLTTLSTYLTRRFAPIVNASFAGLFYAIGFGMLYFTNAMTSFIISTMIWTIGEILVTTNNSVYIASRTPSSHRGRFNAVLPFISFNLGSMLGPLVIGKYMNFIGIRNVWVICSVLSVIASVLLLALYRYESYIDKKRGYCELDIKKGSAFDQKI